MVYLAAPFGEPLSDKRNNALNAKKILENKGMTVFCPWEYMIPHAYEYPNNEWGQMVFINDVKALDGADIVVVLSYGRNSTAGTNWEAGYAFGTGKTVIIVEMTKEIMSVMVSNGAYARVCGLDGLKEYDFNNIPKTRTLTEQK